MNTFLEQYPEAQASHQRALACGDSPLAPPLHLGYAEPRAHLPVAPALHVLRVASGVDAMTACQARDLLVIDDFLADPLAQHRQRQQLLANGVFPGTKTGAGVPLPDREVMLYFM